MNPDLLRRYLTERVLAEGSWWNRDWRGASTRRHAQATLLRLDLLADAILSEAASRGDHGTSEALTLATAFIKTDLNAWNTDDYRGWYDSVVVPELGG